MALPFCAFAQGASKGIPQEIIVTPLSQISADAVGLISAQSAGLPSDFWGTLDADQIKGLITIQRPRLPEARALLQRIMIAELSPTLGASDGAQVLIARLDYLMSIGALDAVEALLNKAQPNTAALFAHWFDAKLLLTRPLEACAPLLGSSSIAHDLATRIYCLAQNQDWFTAYLTLETGRELGLITPEIAELLALFLDPERLDSQAPPAAGSFASPLEFTLREALALARPSKGATLAQLHLDLDDSAGWLQQLRAAERLARTGALPMRYLADVYQNGRASASGGVWERVRALASLRRSLTQNNPAQTCQDLDHAWETLAAVDLETFLADTYGERLATMNLPECTDLQINIILLHQNFRALLFDLIQTLPQSDIRHALVAHEFSSITGQTPLQRAVLRAFDAERSNIVSPAEALLRALAAVNEGVGSDPLAVQRLLEILLDLGYQEEAYRFALEFVILERT
ncbi:hypothetical protein GCM10007939_07140 [Amylibacter marinus]|uniref:Uncharacterized protein n=1 Tax=Amylibacter marinus TaxID=1475483 RepID=A0ABQ5VTE0_9RHOB|nr:hypothetical protein [Amylibacter marinus]GLQ34431.1 hypothetical protein GCM10007939_07140 [Amylibacter marinus]